MKQDPVVGILKIMEQMGSKNNPPSITTGQVISVNPIKIKVGDLILERYNLLINEDLLKHSKEVTINNTSITKEECTVETILKTGDTVAILPTLDLQTYIVLAKVV
ncbi:DUF2577 domain-containing protein [Clostridium massiliodielmoense]|uniref:DUF2577 domain-containing protein n=1 Tax=Clostridium massiliodielmoense TaxID=1776385 RepID=UPI000A26BE65|nr:DUF2577 domain-containing protein [Clostridium massiliodielmoense]